MFNEGKGKNSNIEESEENLFDFEEESEYSESSENNEFLEDFIVEANEHIESIEMNVLLLEKEPENEEILHSMFRSYHTIKGLAGFVEQNFIQKIAHQTESLLDSCRKKTVKVDKTVADIILKSTDYIKKICENIEIARDKSFVAEVYVHLKEIVNIDSKPVAGKIGEILVKQNKMTEEDVKEILNKQKNEYPDLKFGQIAVKENKIAPDEILNIVKSQPVKTVHIEEQMRISAGKVDSLVDMVGELVIIQSLIQQYSMMKLSNDNFYLANFNRMTRITKDLQNLAMFFRMIPLKSTFQKITRIARDTINETNKEVEFITSGEDTEIDRVITEKLLDPLVHLVKNAISHGIEPNEDRVKVSKNPKGCVSVSAYNKRGNIYIEIKDDGGGINTERVRKKALEKGLIDSNREYTEKEIQEFIMMPGFSTLEVANNISGRGVGMDVVKTEIQKIGGKIEINSKTGQGCNFMLKIPVNHAIMNGTVVTIGDNNYIIPTLNVKQIVQPSKDQLISVQNKVSMIKIREDIISLISLPELVQRENKKDELRLFVILELEQKFRALPVDNVIGRQEIVVKPVNEEFKSLDFISGMSILGDGKVSLIFDIENLFKKEGV